MYCYVICFLPVVFIVIDATCVNHNLLYQNGGAKNKESILQCTVRLTSILFNCFALFANIGRFCFRILPNLAATLSPCFLHHESYQSHFYSAVHSQVHTRMRVYASRARVACESNSECN